MNKRLIAFGCSNTYGEGLEDCWINGMYGPKPSKFAWPNVLGNLLGVDEVINLAAPAISNKRIWRDALNFDYQDNDIVVLHWTFVDRDCFFDRVPKIGPWINEKASKFYYKYFWSNLDRHYDLFNRADHVGRYLTSKKIKHYNIQTTGSSGGGRAAYRPEEIPKWFEVDFLPGNMNTKVIDRALDKMHPGPLTHKKFANEVFNKVQHAV